MSATLAIASREFRAFLLSPAAWVIIALFMLFCGIFFITGFQQGELATMRPIFEFGTWMLVFIGPAITMRAISEELRLGTLEMLMTCPVREGQVVLGKFLAAMSFLAVLLLPTAVFVLALEMYGRPDHGEVLCGYLGMTLAGSAYLASGILASVLTASQVVAFLLALFFWMTLGLTAKLLPPHVDPKFAPIIFAADPDLRLRDFAIGLIDTSNIVFFLSFTVVFLLAAAAILRWRRTR